MNGSLHRLRRRLILIGVSAVVALLVACEGGALDSPTPLPEGATQLFVNMGDNFFSIDTLQVKAATTYIVKLRNDGRDIHNMRIAGLDNQLGSDDDFVSDPVIIEPGEVGYLTFRIDTPGVYRFVCDFHIPQGMVGEAIVEQ